MSLLARLDAWFDHRTGYRKILHEALYENIPGGSRWRYVWGSTLVFAFVTQAITGLFLWMAYSPSSQTAWESVYYIQHEMTLGWLLRGVHHFMAQCMVILLALHLMQVVIDGAYRAPREVNFWIGLILLQIVLGLSLTGYLLPWDQKGYWATKVATNIMGQTPVVGPQVQKIVVGGDEYGHHTLTRFFALHAGLLPGMLVLFLVLHIAVFRRHGIHAVDPRRRPDQAFWPDQVLKDAVACLAVLAAVLFCAFKVGAELGAPADPASPYDAARPEWYFLFLFQLLKFLPGILGSLVVPGLVMAVLFLMPILGRWQLGHRFNQAFLFGLLLAAGALTAMAIHHDRNDANYLRAVQLAALDGERAVELAAGGMPPQGGAFLVRRDPVVQGRKLFVDKCAACHSYIADDGLAIQPKEQTAPDLFAFGSRRWLEKFFDPQHLSGPRGFGGTRHLKKEDGSDGTMLAEVKNVAAATAEERKQFEQMLWALSAEAELHYQQEADAEDQAAIAAGRALMEEDRFEVSSCVGCHTFRSQENGGGGAPRLTGWGSRAWLRDLLADPAHEELYADNNDRMPAFGKELSAEQIDWIISFLRQEVPGRHTVEPTPATRE